MDNPDTVERVAWALHADKTAFPEDAWVGDDLTDWGDGELAATVDGTVNFSALARAAIAALTTPADGPTDAFHLTCPNCQQAIDLIPEARLHAALSNRKDATLTTPADGLGEELGRLLDAENAALNSIKNQDHTNYEHAHRDRMLWLKYNTKRIITALRAAQPTERADRTAYWTRTLRDMVADLETWPTELLDALRYTDEAKAFLAHLTPTGTPVVAHETASDDTQAGLCSTDDQQADTPATASRDALRAFVGAAYPVSDVINPRGYNWSEAYLDQALPLARAALATSPDPSGQSVGEWQDIATAPKDGQAVWVSDSGSICVAYFAGEKECCWRNWFKGPRYENVRATTDAYLPEPIWFEPTHWQPLPKPPHQETDNGR